MECIESKKDALAQTIPSHPDDVLAADAAELLKSMANPARLRILCALSASDLTVGELQQALGCSQSYMSGQLLRLREDALVSCERNGRHMRYRIADPRLRPILEKICEMFRPATT